MKSEKKIAVIAGTPVDTSFGCALVREEGREPIPVAISPTPQAQTAFQIASVEEKERVIQAHLEKLKQASIHRALVYCNSLSASVDFASLAQRTRLSIRTPFDFYRQIAPRYRRLGVIAANAQGAAGVERTLISSNSDLSLFSIANIAWVEAIEREEKPDEIVFRYGLQEVAHLFETQGCEGLVLGCTHFPRLGEALSKITSLRVENGDHYLRSWIREGKDGSDEMRTPSSLL